MLWTASEGCDGRAMQAFLGTSVVIYGRASSAWGDGLNGRVRNLPDSVWLHAVRWCLLVWQQDETEASNFTVLWVVAPRPVLGPVAMGGTGRLSP